MTSSTTIESAAAELRQARKEIESLRADNARLRGAFQEALALAEQWAAAAPEGAYLLAPLKALAQTVRSDLGA
jgi:type II secretory pathway component PulM